MTNYILKPEQVGTMNATGIAFPSLDVNGQAYDKVNASTKQIGGGKFVVIPPGGDQPEHTYTLEGAAKVAPKSSPKDS